MGKIKLGKDKSTSFISIFIIVAAYAIERLVEIFFEPSRVVSLILIIGMVVALGVVFALMTKNENPFFGLLASILGYKMLPPTINMVGEVSLYGQEAYYLLRCFATLLFLYLIVKAYRLQTGTKDEIIRVVPILSLMLAVPFFTDIATNSYYFIMTKTGNMLYFYFAQFALYIVASVFMLVVSMKANYNSLRFASYFEWTALGINALKKLGAIVAMAIAGDHISKSYYVWIAIYAAIALMFYIVKNNKKKALSK